MFRSVMRGCIFLLHKDGGICTLRCLHTTRHNAIFVKDNCWRILEKLSIYQLRWFELISYFAITDMHRTVMFPLSHVLRARQDHGLFFKKHSRWVICQVCILGVCLVLRSQCIYTSVCLMHQNKSIMVNFVILLIWMNTKVNFLGFLVVKVDDR